MAKTTLRKLITTLNKSNEKIKINADLSSKKKAEQLKKTVQDFIISGSLTPKLKKGTIQNKTSQGMLYPTHPLYGLGEENAKSMINGIKVRKIKNGYRVQPEGKHHSGLKMQTIYLIHEYGAILKNGGVIPARKLIRKSVDACNRNAKKENDKIAKEIVKVL